VLQLNASQIMLSHSNVLSGISYVGMKIEEVLRHWTCIVSIL